MKAEENVRMHDVHIDRNKALGKKVSRMRILLSAELAVKQDPNDWSDVCRVLEEASEGMGAVDFKTWNRVAKSALVAKPKDKDKDKDKKLVEEKEGDDDDDDEEEEEEKESLLSDENVWVLWGASDYDSHGMVVVGALVGLLRRTAVLPFTSLCEGLIIHKKLVTSARAYSRNPARLQKKDVKETGIAVQKKALDHVEERWDNLLSDMSGGGPWSVIQVRDEDGKVKHGPWAAPGHWAKRTAEDTKGGWESWLGPAELTDHSQIPRAVDSQDAIEQFLASTEGIVAARKKNKGEPLVLDDGVAWNGASKFRTVAVLHMQTTAHMHADERQVGVVSNTRGTRMMMSTRKDQRTILQEDVVIFIHHFCRALCACRLGSARPNQVQMISVADHGDCVRAGERGDAVDHHFAPDIRAA